MFPGIGHSTHNSLNSYQSRKEVQNLVDLVDREREEQNKFIKEEYMDKVRFKSFSPD